MIRLINNSEYKKLQEKKFEECEEWNLRCHGIVNPIINEIIKENEILYRFIFSDNNEDSILRFTNMNIPKVLLDHVHVISLNEEIYDDEGGPLVAGIMAFPYISLSEIPDFEKELGEFWDLYIINPLLIRYSESIGLFILPKRHVICGSDIHLDQFNNFMSGQTGYDLFYKYYDGDVEPIEKIEFNPSFEEFKNFWKGGDYPKLFGKLMDFWHENEEISCVEFDNPYKKYNLGMSWSYSDSVNFKSLKSEVPFEFICPETGWTSGPINEFEFDLGFDCIYIGNHKEIKITNKMYDGFENDKFEFRLIK